MYQHHVYYSLKCVSAGFDGRTLEDADAQIWCLFHVFGQVHLCVSVYSSYSFSQLYNHVSLHLRTHDHLWIHFHLISRMVRKRLQGETIELFVNKWKLKNTLLGSWNNRVVIQLMIVNDNQLLRISIQMQCVIFIFIYTSVVFESCWVCILLSVRLQRIIDPLSISRTERQINTHIVRNTRNENLQPAKGFLSVRLKGKLLWTGAGTEWSVRW